MPLPYQAHSATSRQAAENAAPYARTVRYRVYAYIRDHRGSSDEDIMIGLRANPSTARPRRGDLERLGLIRQIGVKPTQASGCLAATYEVVAGVEYPARWPAEVRATTEPTDNAFLEQVRELAEAVRTGDAPRSEARDALWQMFVEYAAIEDDVTLLEELEI